MEYIYREKLRRESAAYCGKHWTLPKDGQVVKFIGTNDSNQPFFNWAGARGPHTLSYSWLESKPDDVIRPPCG